MLSRLWDVFRLISPGTGILKSFYLGFLTPTRFRQYQLPLSRIPKSLGLYSVISRLLLNRTSHKVMQEEDKKCKRIKHMQAS